MKKNQVNQANVPVIPVRGSQKVEMVAVSDLAKTGQGLVTFGLNVGDTFEFPDSEEDAQIAARTIRDGATPEMLVLGLKNGKEAWLSIGNLRRRDHKMVPVHPVAEALKDAENDQARLAMCYGKKITAQESVTFEEAIFENNVRTDGTRPRTVAKLIFA